MTWITEFPRWALLGGMAFSAATLAHAEASQPDAETAVRQALEQAHPQTRFTAIAATPIEGLFEVWMGGNVAYVSAQHPHLFIFGRLFDTAQMRDLTGLAMPDTGTAETPSPGQTAVVEPEPVDFGQLPMADAIVIARGSGQARLAVFSDPACPYCRQLEAELAQIDNLTTHTFLLPFQGEQLPARIWCASDRARAWVAFMREGDSSELADEGNCPHPLDRNRALAQRLGVLGTPTLIWSDGSRSTGFMTRAAIEARLAAMPTNKPREEGTTP